MTRAKSHRIAKSMIVNIWSRHLSARPKSSDFASFLINPLRTSGLQNRSSYKFFDIVSWSAVPSQPMPLTDPKRLQTFRRSHFRKPPFHWWIISMSPWTSGVNSQFMPDLVCDAISRSLTQSNFGDVLTHIPHINTGFEHQSI